MSAGADRRTSLPESSGAPASIVLERFLPYRLNLIATIVSTGLAQIYAERFGLTIPGWRVIATLGQYGVRTARDIALHSVMHKSTVSRAVSALEQRGLVARRPNADDRREEMLELTLEGQRAYQALAPEALAFESRLVASLSSAELDTFLRLVAKLEDQARAMSPDAVAKAAA